MPNTSVASNNSNADNLREPLVNKNAGAPASTVSTTGAPSPSLINETAIFGWAVKSVGIPKEVFADENRVAATPETVALLVKKGFRVLVENNAGANASFTDRVYLDQGADITDRERCYSADVVLKVNPPTDEEVDLLRPNQCVYSFAKLVTPQGRATLDKMKAKKVAYFGMECVPRISRAQVFDALSSMANIAGYKAVALGAHYYPQFLGGQMTAAGRIPPAKVLVIGGGVAGLSAIVHAKNMGAIVRCFDTRPAVKEQVESLGGEFLELKGFELKEGTGGYAAEMTKEFIDAEMDLFAAQCKEVDIVITTALIPGKPAPKLITKAMIESMKYGSVCIDLAAENGGNIETTKSGEVYVNPNGVTHVGLTDLPSRLPAQSSRLYSNNITKLFLSMTSKDNDQMLNLDMTDDVTRGTILCTDGTQYWPSPRPLGPPPGSNKPKTVAAPKVVETSPFQRTLQTALSITLGCMALIALNFFNHEASFSSMLITFCLSGAAGYQAVWGVTPALHTPLMAVTNAISGITAFGGIIMYSQSVGRPVAEYLSVLATAASCINIFGGFLVTQRMLEMFRRPSDPNEHNYLYLIPALLIPGYFLTNEYEFGVDTHTMTYLAASLCCIGAISGLSSQRTARIGAALGMIGVLAGLVTTFGIVNVNSALLSKMLGQCLVGGVVGLLIGRAVQVTELPQTVAAFHSLVGLAAMTTSIAHYAKCTDISQVDNSAASIVGNFIGGVTLTGSIVAFCKLHGLVKSTALSLPGKNWINSISLGLFFAMSYVFCTTEDLQLGMNMQWSVAVLSMFMGYHLVASVGGGDMPVCITVLNSYSGWALVAEGFMLKNVMMTVVGSLIGFSGAILSYIMCVAMNRSLPNVLFGGYATVAKKSTGPKEVKVHKEATVDVVTDLVAHAQNIIVVPGYGMAVAKAQHALAEFANMCRAKKKNVRFAIHPVAGRMPGQMNVLLAEAGVPYDWVEEMDEINDDFPSTDVCLVIGANDTTNQAAGTDPDCPIAGMPVLHVWEAKNVVFMKRTMASGYADLENPVFFNENTQMFLGDAKKQMECLITSLKTYFDA